ncbi:MAG: aminotransferase class V-fold PLP-dependent enzyme [Thermotogota bacterium]|nr:aminotransferase class V-fold PLP-dependent enzyme [Thermotogota bacterium]
MILQQELIDYFVIKKKDFPLFNKYPDLVYLDSAATTQKPKSVIETMNRYYSSKNANVHRALYALAEESTRVFEESRKKVSDFIDCEEREVIFTRGTTESLNMLAYSLAFSNTYKTFVVPKFEHHSNYVPWQQLARLGVEFVPVNIDNGTFLVDEVNRTIDSVDKPFVFSIAGLTNSLGYRTPFEEITDLVHKKGGIVVVDGAQLIPHEEFSFKKSDVDFVAFSGHKMLGPMGIGALVGKGDLLEKLNPIEFGGEMIDKVYEESTTFNKLPYKFEAGTPNVSGAAGLAKAIDYLKEIGFSKLNKYIEFLTSKAIESLKRINGITIFSDKKAHGIVGFSHDYVHSHDLAELLSRLSNVAIRSGHHCSQLQMKALGIPSMCRASFYLYNTPEDVDALVNGIEKSLRWFS